LTIIVNVKSNKTRQEHAQQKENRFVSTWLPANLVKEMDEAKGDISRNLFIRRAVFKALKEGQEQGHNEI
jgi:hypothetical protein